MFSIFMVKTSICNTVIPAQGPPSAQSKGRNTNHNSRVSSIQYRVSNYHLTNGFFLLLIGRFGIIAFIIVI